MVCECVWCVRRVYEYTSIWEELAFCYNDEERKENREKYTIESVCCCCFCEVLGC